MINGEMRNVTVGKGDLNTKYLLIEQAIDGGGNRSLDPSRVARYAACLEDFERAGSLVLLSAGEGQPMYILDGQHRIRAISEFGQRTYTLRAEIVKLDDIKQSGWDLPTYLLRISDGLARSKNDTYAIYGKESIWTKEATRLGLSEAINYRKRTHNSTAFGWSSIIGARAAANIMLANNATRYDRKALGALNLTLWRTVDLAMVRETMMALKWWSSVHESAVERKIRGLSQQNVLALVFCLYRQSKYLGELEKAGQRLVESPYINEFRYIDMKRSNRANLGLILAGMNYRQRKNIISCFGVTGPEDESV